MAVCVTSPVTVGQILSEQPVVKLQTETPQKCLWMQKWRVMATPTSTNLSILLQVIATPTIVTVTVTVPLSLPLTATTSLFYCLTFFTVTVTVSLSHCLTASLSLRHTHSLVATHCCCHRAALEHRRTILCRCCRRLADKNACLALSLSLSHSRFCVTLVLSLSHFRSAAI